jgi:hypothetical protein
VIAPRRRSVPLIHSRHAGFRLTAYRNELLPNDPGRKFIVHRCDLTDNFVTERVQAGPRANPATRRPSPYSRLGFLGGGCPGTDTQHDERARRTKSLRVDEYGRRLVRWGLCRGRQRVRRGRAER